MTPILAFRMRPENQRRSYSTAKRSPQLNSWTHRTSARRVAPRVHRSYSGARKAIASGSIQIREDQTHVYRWPL